MLFVYLSVYLYYLVFLYILYVLYRKPEKSVSKKMLLELQV